MFFQWACHSGGDHFTKMTHRSELIEPNTRLAIERMVDFSATFANSLRTNTICGISARLLPRTLVR
jgi:hypothetical protein